MLYIKENLLKMSQVDVRYMGTRPFVICVLLKEELDPDHLYGCTQRAMEMMPIFSGKVVNYEGEHFIMYEKNCFVFHTRQIFKDDVSDIFTKASFQLTEFDGYFDDEKTIEDYPLSSVVLTNIKEKGALLTFRFSHVIGDAQTSRMFIVTLANLLLGKKVTKMVSSRCFPFQLNQTNQEFEESGNYLENRYEHHPYQKIRDPRNSRMERFLITKEMLSEIKTSDKSQKDWSDNDMVSAILMRQFMPILFGEFDHYQVKIPINIRYVSSKVENTYMGNAYLSLDFELEQKKLEQTSMEEMIEMVHEKVSDHKNNDRLDQLFQLKDGQIQKKSNTKEKKGVEIIISHIGNAMSNKRLFGEGMIRDIITITSDKNAFVVQKDTDGYRIQAFLKQK